MKWSADRALKIIFDDRSLWSFWHINSEEFQRLQWYGNTPNSISLCEQTFSAFIAIHMYPYICRLLNPLIL